MRLTRKGWNNVIIFAAMAMILVLNLSNEKLFEKSDSQAGQQPLIPHGELILTMTVNRQYTIERIGTSWRVSPELSMPTQRIAAMMQAWQDSVGLTLPEQPSNVEQLESMSAMLSLAGRPQPYIIDFYNDEQQLIVYLHDSQQWMTFAKASFHQLFPQRLINAL